MTGGTRGAWSDSEVDAVVDLYLQMLDADLNQQRIVKAQAYRDLAATETPTRSTGAIESKLQNISAVMTDLGLPFVTGLRPRRNIQGSLTEAVRSRLLAPTTADTLDTLVEIAAERAASYVSGGSPAVVPPPGPAIDHPPLHDVRHFDWDEAERRRLGLFGERWVVEHERRQLDGIGRPDLARDVLHVSVEHGDGAGYDIRSFSPDGSERLVEVKTTASPIGRSFHVSRNEIAVSREQQERYWLYRVFDFYTRPLMYQVRGALDEGFQLTPASFIARP